MSEKLKFYYKQKLYYTIEGDSKCLNSFTVKRITGEGDDITLGNGHEYSEITFNEDQSEIRKRYSYNSSSIISYISDNKEEAMKISAKIAIKEAKEEILRYDRKIKENWEIIREANKHL